MSADTGRRTERISQEAAEWFTSHREGWVSTEQRAQFAQWLAESPVHVREYLAIAESWAALKDATPFPEDSRDSLLEVLRATPNSNIVPLSNPATMRESRLSRLRHSRFFALCASIAILIPLALTVLWWTTIRGDVYRTARGEQRSVVLQDGSVVQLNTLTRMVVHYDGKHRRIELPEGEAFFRVAHDPERPFDVETPYAVVRAVGTEFNVYARAKSTQVAVVDGKVQVAARPATSRGDVSHWKSESATPAMQPIALKALERIAIDGAGTAKGPAVAQPLPSTEVATAWIQRRLVFDNERVDQAADEFNRYNQVQLRVTDASLAGLRISGVFSADDPLILVKYLEKIKHVRATRADSVITLTYSE